MRQSQQLPRLNTISYGEGNSNISDKFLSNISFTDSEKAGLRLLMTKEKIHKMFIAEKDSK